MAAVEQVESLDDPRLLPYRDLKGRDPARQAGQFVVENELLVRRLFTSRFATASVLVIDRMLDRLLPHVPHGVPVYVADEPTLKAIVGFNYHRGVMACGVRPTAAELTLDRILAAIDEASPSAPRTLVVCPFLNQHENLGLIIRTAAGLGADGLLVSDRGADPFYRRTVRVSTGGIFTLPLAMSDNVAADLRRLRDEHGYELLATRLAPDATPLTQYRPSERVAILAGGEFEGLPPQVTALCGRQVVIPMHRGVDSLNVAVATGIVLHHVLSCDASVRQVNRPASDV